MRKIPRTKLLSLLLPVLLLATACGQNADPADEAEMNDKILVYTSLFPIFDFARQIGGEYVDVRSIVPPGTEAHDFEPSPKDMTQINEAALFMYNGAGYETWIEKISENLDPSNTVIEVSQGIELLQSDAVEEDEQEEHDGEAEANDPHIWLDPMLAKQQADRIREALSAADPEHKEQYQENYDALAAELDELDENLMSAVSSGKKKVFVTSHRAFAYLANRYGLKQIGVSGLSPSEEPSQKDLQHLIEVVKEQDIKYVAFEELVENKIAKTVQREAGVDAIILNPLENVTKEQFDSGATYVSLMTQNLESLKKMLEAL